MEHASVYRLIVGLGNPGARYARTRHNAGFMVLDELAHRTGGEFRFESKWKAEIAPWGDAFLMKPQTYMNLSGESVGAYARFFKVDASEMMVVLDDIALPLGDVRLRKSGSAGGHNGLESIINHQGTHAVPRLRVGISGPSGTLHDYVLGTFSQEEAPQLEKALARGADAVEHARSHGFEAAMNIFNQRTTV